VSPFVFCASSCQPNDRLFNDLLSASKSSVRRRLLLVAVFFFERFARTVHNLTQHTSTSQRSSSLWRHHNIFAPRTTRQGFFALSASRPFRCPRRARNHACTLLTTHGGIPDKSHLRSENVLTHRCHACTLSLWVRPTKTRRSALETTNNQSFQSDENARFTTESPKNKNTVELSRKTVTEFPMNLAPPCYLPDLTTSRLLDPRTRVFRMRVVRSGSGSSGARVVRPPESWCVAASPNNMSRVFCAVMLGVQLEIIRGFAGDEIATCYIRRNLGGIHREQSPVLASSPQSSLILDVRARNEAFPCEQCSSSAASLAVSEVPNATFAELFFRPCRVLSSEVRKNVEPTLHRRHYSPQPI